ncbi:SpoIIE family protein phosphatase [Streptomyces sp. NPDC047028]|uniref:ATP-binding SpoIIE family protein phosphatase n=1 Tax=Streptomyces sp. NPDC047028 TaxID=3155793 RepID=UPI0033F6CA33
MDRRVLGTLPRRLRGVVSPVVPRRTARARLAWLNEASTSIGTTLDLRRTAQEVTDFCVPWLADAAAVDLLESVLLGEDGAHGIAGTAPAMRAMAVSCVAELCDLEPDPVGEPSTFEHNKLVYSVCVSERRAAVVNRMRRPDFERVAPTPSAAEQMRKAGVHSYLAVPLVARGVLLGIADFLRCGASPPFGRADVELATQLASKAAVSVDNARLYGREREHVVSLQRTLLPRAIPSTAGLRVTGCYAPADDPHGVGGDWFDVVALPGGRTALVVGDVMGHGLPAAATMGRLRTVARALLSLDIAPERVLARLDLAARDLEDDQVATCLCAVYDPATTTYTLASAGHPPPLLVPEPGSAQYAPVPVGAPLGAGVIPYDAACLTVPARGRLVLYSDGLVKTRRGGEDIDEQLEGLRAAAAGLSGEDLDGCRLTRTVPNTGNRYDESVLLVAAGRPEPLGGDMRVWRLPPDGTAAGTARRLVTEQLRHWELEELSDVSELVVSELIGNALRHGGAPGELRMLRHDRLMLEVSDRGPDLPQIQHATESDEGGRGLQLINMLCRRWGSCRIPEGKVVWVEQDLPNGRGAT